MIAGFEKNVFINCPFDEAYQTHLLRPLLFTVVYLGFNPRIALESSDASQSRLEKLSELIKNSIYSIHDLSRLQSNESKEFYRLNMPFELGLDYGAKCYHNGLSEKKFLILAKEPYDYQKAISDISGLDIKHHGDDPKNMVECVRDWFIETIRLQGAPFAKKIWDDFNYFNTILFKDKLLHYVKEYGGDEEKAKKTVEDGIDKMKVREYINEVKSYISKP